MAINTQEPLPIYKPQPLKGLNQISEEEKKAFIDEQVAAGKLPKAWKFSQAERLYKNKQFRDKYGEDAYKSITDKTSGTYLSPEMRDEYYDRMEYLTGVESKYASDPNLNNYRVMTTEGLKDLWDSGIMSPEELSNREAELETYRESSTEGKKKHGKLWTAFVNANVGVDADGKPLPSGNSGLAAEGIAYKRGLLTEDEKKAYDKKVDSMTQKIKNTQEGYFNVGMSDEEVDAAIKNLYTSNAKKIEDLQKREDERVINLPAVQNEVSRRDQLTYQKINDQELSYEDVKQAFEQTFDNDVREDGAGSRYYTGYKDKNELANFGVDDMLKTLNEFAVLTEAFGGDSAKAMQVIDTKMFNEAKSNQNFMKRRWNTLRGVAAKANSMLVNEAFGGFADLGHALLDNPDEYKTYKTAENVLTAGGLGYLFNPNYWNYVDQYAMWNPYEIQRINDNQGIGGRVNLYSPTGKMTAEQFVDEGFKMLGYMLPAAAITAATKKVPAGSGWAKLIAGWEIAGSAAALGSAYSTGVYNETLLGSQQALDKMFDEESKDFVKQYYAEHPNYVEDYLKSRGLTDNDSDIMTIPAKMAAERALYDEAKEAYFNENQDRRRAYTDAQDQILYDAQNGAKWDDLIETGRMLVAGSFWGKWTKSKLTRDLLNKGVNPINVVDRTAQQAAKEVGRKKAAAITFLSGGVDNWLDDITAGIGKGLGLNDFNNYLGTVYGPDNFTQGAKFTADILDGMYWGAKGAKDAYYNPQTWIDGALGATGSVLGARINAITLVRDAIAKEGYFSRLAEEGAKSKEEWNNLSTWQKLNRYVTNGITTSMSDADAVYGRTEEYIKQINDEVIPKYSEDIQRIGSFLNENFDFNTIADSVIDGKDIKQMGMLKSAIRMLDALKDPVISQIPEVQQFADMLNRGRKGKFTEAEIQSFINDPSNIDVKNRVEGSKDTSIAVEEMRKNINSFLEIANAYTDFTKGISKNPKFSVLNDNAKTNIAVQMTLRDVWKKRLDSMQDALNTPGTEKAAHSYEAEFGSVGGRDRVIKSLETLLENKKAELGVRARDAQIKGDILNRATSEKEREVATKAYLTSVFLSDHTRDVINEYRALLNEAKRANVTFDERGYARTLSKEEILRLSPKQRAQMLNPENNRNYSPEQVRIIDELSDELRNHIGEDGTTQDLYQVALDAGTMQERYENSNKSLKEVVKHPYMLQTYADRLKERRMAILAQAALEDARRDQLEKLATVTTPEEAIEVVYRGKYPANTADRGFYVPAAVVKEYIEEHPESSDLFKEALDMVQVREDLFSATENQVGVGTKANLSYIIGRATRDANNKAEILSAMEDLIDIQTSPEAKLQLDQVLEKMKTYGYQRDATKIRNREEERRRKAEEEAKKAEAEAKQQEQLKQEAEKAAKEAEEKTKKEGETKPTEKAPEAPQPAEENLIPESEEDVPLVIDAEGKTTSPSAEEQAATERSEVITVPTDDSTEQGNVITETADGVISGNRWVTYSVEGLRDGIVREETAKDPTSVFGELMAWLADTKTNLQEIIDEEFGRILVDNPDVDIRFMMVRDGYSRKNNLTKLLFNVVELTSAMRQKYHDESRGGVIEANGKSWLVVGTTGFENGASNERMHAYDVMKGPMNKRRNTFFKNNGTAKYYVDEVAYSRVQNTTSGRIVNQRLGETEAKLQKVSDLLKSAGMSLRQAVFGIQTKEVGAKSFAVTKNNGNTKIFPPRNVEDNRGRTFIMVETANGNRIPGMIEPAMFNNLAENSSLADIINSTIAGLFSTNYETRRNAISALRGYLLLEDKGKNILIGKDGINTLTIRVPGKEDITQQLGASFDSVKFLKDLRDANFQLNITLKALNDPDMLKIYDESGALMTSVASMRTAGMSYTIYMTDASGKPIINTPEGNAVPGTGKSDFKRYQSVRVNNNTYELKNGVFIDRNTKKPVDPNSDLGKSCIYNRAIEEGGWVPFATRGNKEFYNVRGDNGVIFVVSRDTLGNVEFLTQEESNDMLEKLRQKQEKQQRAENIEDVNLYEDEAPTPKGEPTSVEDVTLDDINRHILGDFSEAPAPVEAETPTEVAKEIKENNPVQPKEVISTVGTKSLAELQNTENLSTFEQINGNMEYSDRLYDILETKNWGVTGDFVKDAEILKAHGIAVVGITNVEDWLNLIKNCK